MKSIVSANNFNNSGDMMKSSGSITEEDESESYGKGKHQVNYSTSTYNSKK